MSRTASTSDSDASLSSSSSDEPPSSSTSDPSTPPAAAVAAPAARFPLSAGECRRRDWRWQLRNRIRTVEDLRARFPGIDAAGVAEAARKFPLAVTPYYASLIRTPDASDPIFRMAVPDARELLDPPFLSDDPLAEDADMPVPGLVHRYADRALLLVTTTCATYCRHCTRKRLAGAKESTISPARLAQAVAYLRSQPRVRDVIISGGDPLTMSSESLGRVLAAVRAVPTVEIIRIGTRAPVVLPQRITDELVGMLRRHHPLWMNTHFNHPRELTCEAAEACARLVDAGIPLGNQSVLLRGINDRPEVMEELVRGLVRMRVRPYYLFQCDLVRGVEHFRTPLARGIEIMKYLRGRVGGLAIPLFAVDAPHGGGKVPIMPDYVVSVSPTRTVLRNLEGMPVSYPEPYAPSGGCG
ncbi:MAG: KamA family radical SAM protein [Planctomycetes bacterium]|nr:KamA family radical SAM protein [Planctomycetota bacterium]